MQLPELLWEAGLMLLLHISMAIGVRLLPRHQGVLAAT